MTRKRTFDWEGVEYASPEYYRRWRLANNDKSREYHRKYDQEMYKKHPEREQARRKRYADKYPHKVKAHKAVRNAIVSGKLIKQSCINCNEPRTVAHHEDYNKPLDVIWYCEVHHKARHKEIEDSIKQLALL